MSPATRLMLSTIIRLSKGIIKAIETWLDNQPERR
jgi:hypothetical protein